MDSWKRPTYESKLIDQNYVQQLELQLNKTREATPEEVKEWQNGGDFFMTGNFDALKMFVVLPTMIQLIMIGFMLSVFVFNQNLFS
tara:strand:+ start:296 stop:553 length:258 start_codon:yes stop_codon:yes gene_type:complete